MSSRTGILLPASSRTCRLQCMSSPQCRPLRSVFPQRHLSLTSTDTSCLVAVLTVFPQSPSCRRLAFAVPVPACPRCACPRVPPPRVPPACLRCACPRVPCPRVPLFAVPVPACPVCPRVPRLPSSLSEHKIGKIGGQCSVENLNSDNHYIMRYGPQDDLAELVGLDPRAERRAKQPLDHRVDGLHLPSLATLALQSRERLLHHSSPSPRRQFLRRSAPRRRDDRPNAVRAGADMDPFGVEVGIGQEG